MLAEFERHTRGMPASTEVERLVIQRVGQDLFWDGLLRYAGQRCMVTGVALPAFLRASHIKPWRDCETDEERLDVYNGLLLAVQWDTAFDQGFVTFGGDGVNDVVNPHQFGSAGLLHPKLVAPKARDQLDVTAGGQEV